MSRRVRAMALLLLLPLLAACPRKSADQNEGKRMPKPPPPPTVEVTPELRITVDIDGKPAAPIDAARLNATPPDFQDPEHRAWRMATLLGSTVERANAVIAVTGQAGMTVLLKPTAKVDGGTPMPVLTLTRRGEVVVAMVAPTDPFPKYHGRGGMLARPGDPLPRIADVTSIRVYVEKSGAGGQHGGTAR